MSKGEEQMSFKKQPFSQLYKSGGKSREVIIENNILQFCSSRQVKSCSADNYKKLPSL